MEDAITTGTAPYASFSFISSIFICFLFSIFYIGALYLLSPSNQRYDRNHSDVILRRFLAVFIVCLLVYLFLQTTSNSDLSINTWLGLRLNIPSLWTLIICPVLLTLLLYLGPLVQWCWAFHWRHFRADLRYFWFSWPLNDRLIFIRNYFVAPFTEEFVYRSSILCVLYSHISLASAIFLSPLFFGLAHLHHMLEHFHQNSRLPPHCHVPPLRILLIHLFQFLYTYLFGAYSSFLFIRSGHFIPSFIVHALCNALGLPDIPSLFDRRDRQVKRKVLFTFSYCLGLYLFIKNLFFLTQSEFFYANESLILYRQWSN